MQVLQRRLRRVMEDVDTAAADDVKALAAAGGGAPGGGPGAAQPPQASRLLVAEVQVGAPRITARRARARLLR